MNIKVAAFTESEKSSNTYVDSWKTLYFFYHGQYGQYMHRSYILYTGSDILYITTFCR